MYGVFLGVSGVFVFVRIIFVHFFTYFYFTSELRRFLCLPTIAAMNFVNKNKLSWEFTEGSSNWRRASQLTLQYSYSLDFFGCYVIRA